MYLDIYIYTGLTSHFADAIGAAGSFRRICIILWLGHHKTGALGRRTANDHAGGLGWLSGVATFRWSGLRVVAVVSLVLCTVGVGFAGPTETGYRVARPPIRWRGLAAQACVATTASAFREANFLHAHAVVQASSRSATRSAFALAALVCRGISCVADALIACSLLLESASVATTAPVSHAVGVKRVAHVIGRTVLLLPSLALRATEPRHAVTAVAVDEVHTCATIRTRRADALVHCVSRFNRHCVVHEACCT